MTGETVYTLENLTDFYRIAAPPSKYNMRMI